MKKLLLTLLAVGITGTGFADIQAPPDSQQTAIRKLGRGISNVLYGLTELPVRVVNVNSADGNNAGFGTGIVEGTTRSVVRIGHGIIEICTFPVRTYKRTYKARYQNIEYDPFGGYAEYAPEIGWQSKFRYGRKQNY